MATDIMMGRGQVIGFGLESTVGTPVSRSIYVPAISANAKVMVEQAETPDLYVGTGGVPSRIAALRRTLSGTAEVLLSYTALGLLLRATMGSTATTGSGPYDHSFTLSDAPASLTIEVPRGTPTSGTRRSDVHAGCQITKLTIVAEAGNWIRCQIEWKAMSNTPANTGTPTITQPTFAECHQGSTLGWNSSTYDIRRMELSIVRPFAERFNLGALGTEQMHIEDKTEIRLRVTLDLESEDFITAHGAYTESDATFTFTGSGNLAFAITAHSARVLTAPDNPINSFGRVEQTVEFAPRNVPGGSDYGLEIVVSNDESSYAS